jgi:hypothetical protein
MPCKRLVKYAASICLRISSCRHCISLALQLCKKQPAAACHKKQALKRQRCTGLISATAVLLLRCCKRSLPLLLLQSNCLDMM